MRERTKRFYSKIHRCSKKVSTISIIITIGFSNGEKGYCMNIGKLS